MKYVALLRGINVGGNSLIKMADLKVGFEKIGFNAVKTYINSGNVIFVSDENDGLKLAEKIEEMIVKNFKLTVKTLVLSHEEMLHVAANVPKDWKTRDDIRCYLGFLFPHLDAKEEAKNIKVREGIDWLDTSQGVLYMTTLTSGLTKSAFSKMAGTPMYKNMTIRNYNTTKKIIALMEE